MGGLCEEEHPALKKNKIKSAPNHEDLSSVAGHWEIRKQQKVPVM